MAQLRLANAYPDDGFATVDFKVNNPVQVTESMNGKIRRVGMGNNYFTFGVKYNNVSRVKGSAIMAYLTQAQGQLFAFDIVLPSISYTKLTNQITGTVTVTGGTDTWTENGVAKTGYTTGRGQITVTGSNGALFAAGDVFRFNDLNYPGDDNANRHLKVYMATAAASISSGSGTVYFTGGLVDNVPNGTTLTYTAVPFQVVLTNGMQTYSVGQGGITNMEFECREV
jgi:hypothetical protein